MREWMNGICDENRKRQRKRKSGNQASHPSVFITFFFSCRIESPFCPLGLFKVRVVISFLLQLG